MTTLKPIPQNHWSADTAYVVSDYPYGFRLRCKIRYWLEYQEKKGYRLWSQTTNPKKPGEVWNTPKASTYSPICALMVLDSDNHLTWTGLSIYTDHKASLAFKELWYTHLNEREKSNLDLWIKMKEIYEAKIGPKLYPDLYPKAN